MPQTYYRKELAICFCLVDTNIDLIQGKELVQISEGLIMKFTIKVLLAEMLDVSIFFHQ